MVAFTLITGIATLVSLLLQFSNLAGDKRKYVIYSTFFLAGLTLGMVLNIAFTVNLNFPVPITPKQLVGVVVICGNALLAFVLFTISAVIKDERQRTYVRNIAGTVSGFLFFLLVLMMSTFFD